MKNKLLKRITAYILLLTFCLCTMCPVTVFAIGNSNENPYNISSSQSISVEPLTENDSQLAAMKKHAENYRLGGALNGFNPIYGKLLSPFKLTSEEKLVEISMDVPQRPELDADFFDGLKIAVQNDREGAAVHFFPVTIDNESNRVSAKIPLTSGSAVLCALVSYQTSSTLKNDLDVNNFNLPNSIIENTEGSLVQCSWEFQVSKGSGSDSGILGGSYLNTDAEIYLDLGVLELNPSSVKLTTSEGAWKAFDIEEIRENVDGSGVWVIKLMKPPVVNDSDVIGQNGGYDQVTLSFDAVLSHEDFTPGERATIIAELGISQDLYAPSGGGAILGMTQVDFNMLPELTSAVTITPADMTIYMGGDGGYDAVVGEETSEEGVTSNSLPHPLFTVDMPKGSSDDPTDLTFTNGQEGESEKRWTLVCANPNSEGTKYYYFQEGEDQDKVRVTYTDRDGKAHISDSFNPSEVKDVFTTYEIALYPGDNNIGEIKARVDNTSKEYAVSANTGTLTVRAVEDSNPTSAIQTKAPENRVAFGTAVAVEPEGGTTYTLNGTGVPLPGIASDTNPNGSKPSLLFDSIIEDDANSTARTDALIAKANEKLDAVDNNTTRYYEVKYLDLVDANNGNAWITSSEGMDIYWGYPDGTNDQTTFKLVHLKGLHRDDNNGNSGYDVNDINTLTSENIEVIQVTNKENGIKFHVEPGNFSPYVLVWEKTSTSHNPGIIPTPDPDPTPTPEPEEPAQPELERDDHYAYIFGYEDNTIRPENDITRAEVATIFYRLLTDESREAYRTTDHDFTDVSADAWHVEPVATLASAGLLAGYEDGTFRPDQNITRAEYAAIATRFDELEEGTSAFTDISGHWAENAINAAYGAGWVGGYEDGTFRPDQNITRAEAMALINRVLERAVDSEGMLDEMTHWADNDPDAWYYADVQEATHSHTYEREEGEQYENWTDLVPHKVF